MPKIPQDKRKKFVEFVLSHPQRTPIQDVADAASELLGQRVSYEQVRHVRRENKKTDTVQKMTPKQQIERDRQLNRYRTDRRSIEVKYNELLKKHELTEEQLRIALNAGDIQIQEIPPPINNQKSEATAVIVASDWHLEEEVRPESVTHRNAFNLTTAEARVQAFWQNATKLLKKEQQGAEITDCVIALLGDFISSNIHEELLELCLLPPMDAVIFAEEMIANGIQYMLDNTEGVNFTIPCVVGNHTRITKRQRHATEHGNALETVIYHHLARHFSGEPRVKFFITKAYHTYVEIYDYTLRFHHGHNIRYGGGIGGITIPVNKAIAQWQKIRHADLDVFGHWHQFLDGGNFISNGSLIGFNAYALSIKAGYEPPRQTFFLIDKRHGKSMVTPIFLSEGTEAP